MGIKTFILLKKKLSIHKFMPRFVKFSAGLLDHLSSDDLDFTQMMGKVIGAAEKYGFGKKFIQVYSCEMQWFPFKYSSIPQ